MSQLESLLSIAKMQSQRQLFLLQNKKQFIVTLEQQLEELVEYSRAYQKDLVGVDGSVATLLGHRQRFVGQLREQMDELEGRLEKLRDDAERCANEWQHFESRKNAVEAMYVKECAVEEYEVAKADQRILDELANLKREKKLDSVENSGLDYA